MSQQPNLLIEEGHITEMSVRDLLTTYQVGGSGPWAAHHCSDCRCFDDGRCSLYALPTTPGYCCPDFHEPPRRPLVKGRWLTKPRRRHHGPEVIRLNRGAP